MKFDILNKLYFAKVLKELEKNYLDIKFFKSLHQIRKFSYKLFTPEITKLLIQTLRVNSSLKNIKTFPTFHH